LAPSSGAERKMLAQRAARHPLTPPAGRPFVARPDMAGSGRSALEHLRQLPDITKRAISMKLGMLTEKGKRIGRGSQ
jgi:hypothetical protein